MCSPDAGIESKEVDELNEIAESNTAGITAASGIPREAPCWAAPGVELYLGDCLNILPSLDGIDAVVTSPPYNLNGFHQMHNGNSAKWQYGEHNDNMPEDKYQEWQVELCEKLFDICSGPLFYSHKNRISKGRMISPIIWLSKTRWVIHQAVVVNKGSGANVDKRRFFPVHELVFVCLKDAKGRINNDSCRTDVWLVGGEQTNRKDAGHPAVMPISVAENCVQAAPGNTVLDPFMGSGTTGIACIRSGRKFIGIEKDAKYFEIAKERIRNELKQGRLF